MPEANDQLAWDFGFPSIDGGTLNFSDFKGQVLLVTNTASFCGYTPQYAGLEKLHQAKSGAGLVVVTAALPGASQVAAASHLVGGDGRVPLGVAVDEGGVTEVQGERREAGRAAEAAGQTPGCPAGRERETRHGVAREMVVRADRKAADIGGAVVTADHGGVTPVGTAAAEPGAPTVPMRLIERGERLRRP